MTGVALVGLALLLCFVIGSIWWSVHAARRRGTYSPLTEDMQRLPGHSLRLRVAAMDDALIETALMAVVGISMAMLPAATGAAPSVAVTGSVVAVGAAVYAWRRIGHLLESRRRLTLGLECEEYVGQELNLLMREGAFVFHDIPYRYGNIDHVVVGHGRAFAVETKGRRKPKGVGGARSRDARVRFDGTTLAFPGYETRDPIEQARRHAEFLADAIGRRCGFAFEVIPVVVLPGWHVDAVPFGKGGVLVVNGKRGRVLRHWLGERGDRVRSDRVAAYLDSVARSIPPGSRKTDPDAAEHYDFWFDPRVREVTID